MTDLEVVKKIYNRTMKKSNQYIVSLVINDKNIDIPIEKDDCESILNCMARDEQFIRINHEYFNKHLISSFKFVNKQIVSYATGKPIDGVNCTISGSIGIFPYEEFYLNDHGEIVLKDFEQFKKEIFRNIPIFLENKEKFEKEEAIKKQIGDDMRYE